jgi:aspartate racemase
MTAKEKTVGVIGGMGPEATIEFMRRLVTAVSAKDDADHLHVIVDNNPKIPSRIKALIEGGGEDPEPCLVDMARKLEAAGADFLVIPCNTAHYYLPAIAKSIRIPVLDVVALTIDKLNALERRPARIGMLASPAVRLVGLFEKRLVASAYQVLFPNPETEGRLLDVIRAVKSGHITPSHHRTYEAIANHLADDGADTLLVACTELSLLPALERREARFDTLDVLVEATVRTARG